jgi:hypothetical protein
MSSSSLQVFSAGVLGIQGLSVLASEATRQAAVSTAALAGVGPSGLAAPILTATGQPVSAPSYLSSADPDEIRSLKTAAQSACFGPDASGTQCSYWSQRLAAAQAARHCPAGDIYNSVEAFRRQSSIDLPWPTFVAPVVASTEPVNSVAISMTASTPPNPVT